MMLVRFGVPSCGYVGDMFGQRGGGGGGGIKSLGFTEIGVQLGSGTDLGPILDRPDLISERVWADVG